MLKPTVGMELYANLVSMRDQHHLDSALLFILDSELPALGDVNLALDLEDRSTGKTYCEHTQQRRFPSILQADHGDVHFGGPK